MKRSLLIALSLIVLAAIAVGSYSLSQYHQAAPPIHNKQPAFSPAKSVATLGADSSTQTTAQPKLPPVATSQGSPAQGTATPSVTSAAHSLPPQSNGNTTPPAHGLRAVLHKLLGL